MEIVPLTGVSGAGFGQSRASVRAVRGGPDSAFRRGADAPLTDLYADESCVFFEYDDADLLHAIEIASPGPVTLHGVRLLGRPEDDVASDRTTRITVGRCGDLRVFRCSADIRHRVEFDVH
jgi:hypothetical protein